MAGVYGSNERTWDSNGRGEFIKLCKESGADEDEFRQHLHNLCKSVIKGNLRPDSASSVLSEVVTLSKNGPNILTDVLLLCDIETQASDNKEQRDKYLWLTAACSNKVVSDSLLRERLDVDTAAESGIIPDKKLESTKFIKLKTRLIYKQQKYNLLREESEGYAKLITELCQDGRFDVDYMLHVIRSLIGCFNLDPNRVVDIILECFENRPHLDECYIPLIRRFFDNSTTLTQLLAFKYSFYQNDVDSVTPESLHHITALVISNQLISLTELYSYLMPIDRLVHEYSTNELTEARLIARKANIISTAEEKPKEEKFTAEEKHSLLVNNQKLGLCSALLKIGNWNDARRLIAMMPEHYATSDVEISKNLAVLVHVGIDKLYRVNSGLPTVIEVKLKPYRADKVRYMKPAENISDLKQLVFPMVSTLGPFMCYDTLLIAKVIRLGKSLLVKQPETKADVLNMLEDAILPAISLVVSNCGLCEELWGILKKLPYENRYRLYSSWKSESNNPALIKVRAVTLMRIKYIMKRLSKENVKVSGRHIGKLSHANPSFLFDYILSQIQTYDNLIGPVVDSLKFLTSVSYDVLIFCVIEALADPRKDRTKHDGATISPWLLSLANFCGSVVRKYSVELPGLIQFIANQLKAERNLDLLILKEIVNKMAGIEATEEMTNEQLAALAGGELLRAECGYFNQVRNTKKSSNRLKDALLQDNMAMPLCMLMAQQRNCILFSEQEHSHLKLVGKLYDQCQETLVQYGSFLSNNLSIDDYINCVPSLEKLITEFHLSADVAFFLVRPMILHHITLKYFELRRGENPLKSNPAYLESWESVTQPIVDAMIPALKNKFWDDLSPRLYVSFWTLSMYDLEVPKPSYDKEVDRLKELIKTTEENKELQPSKKKKEVERGRLLQEKLLEEQLKQDEHVRRVRFRLDQEKEQWFQSNSAKSEMTTQFFQHCLFPRCIFTASDALYCAKYVHLLHTLKTPNFSTLICYDRIFGDISYTMCSCTENEANHYGRFLSSILEVVSRWHKDKAIFDTECAKFPGFVTKFTENNPYYVDYESYRHVCHKWHYRLTKAFILCLDSEDYIQIRNSLLVLTKILPFFPVIASFAQAIERRVENTRKNEKDKRPDIYALATGYAGQLKLKKSAFVLEGEFHEKKNPPKPQVAVAKDEQSEGPVPPPPSKKEKVASTSSVKVSPAASNGTSSKAAAVIPKESREVTSNIRIKTEPGEIVEVRNVKKSSSSDSKSEKERSSKSRDDPKKGSKREKKDKVSSSSEVKAPIKAPSPRRPSSSSSSADLKEKEPKRKKISLVEIKEEVKEISSPRMERKSETNQRDSNRNDKNDRSNRTTEGSAPSSPNNNRGSSSRRKREHSVDNGDTTKRHRSDEAATKSKSTSSFRPSGNSVEERKPESKRNSTSSLSTRRNKD